MDKFYQLLTSVSGNFQNDKWRCNRPGLSIITSKTGVPYLPLGITSKTGVPYLPLGITYKTGVPYLLPWLLSYLPLGITYKTGVPYLLPYLPPACEKRDTVVTLAYVRMYVYPSVHTSVCPLQSFWLLFFDQCSAGATCGPRPSNSYLLVNTYVG